MSDSTEPMTATQLIEAVSDLSHGATIEITGVPQFREPLTFLGTEDGGEVFYALETEPTEIPEVGEAFKLSWMFIVQPERGGANNGVVQAYSVPSGEIPADATADTISPTDYSYQMVTEAYPRAFSV